MISRGLEAWHDHMVTHLEVKTPGDLKAVTDADLVKYARTTIMSPAHFVWSEGV